MSKKVKEKLYKQFLKIPVYQDMATWNIQFRGSQLSYVDKGYPYSLSVFFLIQS